MPKKTGLDDPLKNSCPICNLLYISKFVERAVVTQITEYTMDNDLECFFQSAYKANHSTETALLNVKNDILLNMNSQHVTLQIVLDLSTAFDTINHDILIDCLKNDLRIESNALAWLKSNLIVHSEFMVPHLQYQLLSAVPQGSCLGPLLFTIYTRMLFKILRGHLPLYTVMRMTLNSICRAMTECLSAIRSWMISNRLMLNDGKTEFLLIGIRQQLAKINIKGINVGSDVISPASVVRNLGGCFDSQLTMSTHISKACASSYYHLHSIRRIKKYLTVDTTKALVHALVTSCIDSCNSLLYAKASTSSQHSSSTCS